MAFWDADLTTRMGADTATSQAGLACFILAGFRILGALFFGGLIGLETLEGQVVAVTTGIEALVALIAGFRFRAGKGAFWGIAAAVLLGISILNSLIGFAIGGVVIGAVFLVVIVQGIRGAFALRAGGFDEDELEAFE